jgi:hypothetical protein
LFDEIAEHPPRSGVAQMFGEVKHEMDAGAGLAEEIVQCGGGVFGLRDRWHVQEQSIAKPPVDGPQSHQVRGSQNHLPDEAENVRFFVRGDGDAWVPSEHELLEAFDVRHGSRSSLHRVGRYPTGGSIAALPGA